MGFWDVLLFNIATVLGPRWIAAAAHNGTSSISLWVLAAVLVFFPMALVINELSSRFPEEGGLYGWSKEAFGDFHGFVAGWESLSYPVFCFSCVPLSRASVRDQRRDRRTPAHVGTRLADVGCVDCRDVDHRNFFAVVARAGGGCGSEERRVSRNNGWLRRVEAWLRRPPRSSVGDGRKRRRS